MLQTVSKPSLMLQRLLTFTLLSAAACAQGETWVVTDHAHPVTNTAEHRVILLDEQQRLEAYLTTRLPSAPRQAASTIQVYLASPEGTRFQHELAQAQQGTTDAWSLGVEKIPAVVVDLRYVVYGEPDVAKAIALIDRARRAQQ
jgi:integrating conjugative element protein (TIGR03757 family)